MKVTKSILALFTLCLMFSCKKDDPAPTTTPTPLPTPTSTYYINYMSGGISTSVQDQKSNYYMGSTSTGGFWATETLWLFLGAKIADINTTQLNGAEIGIDNIIADGNTYNNDRQAAMGIYFSVGNHSFASSATSTVGAFVKTDFLGEDLNTAYGDQTGSTFTITETTALVDDFGNPQRKVKGTFSCKMYNSAGTFVKDYTSGSFYLIFDAY